MRTPSRAHPHTLLAGHARGAGRLAVLLTLLCASGLALAQTVVDAVPTTYREAPQLAVLVAAGQLPPVEERLPLHPLVVEPLERIGQYGGTLRTGILEPADTWMRHLVGYDHLVTWRADWTGTIPNVVRSVDVSDDATVYTFHLREGLKWSDGAPYTADDLLFLYENIWLHPELPNFPSEMRTAAGPGVIAKVDESTVTVTFPMPFGLFLEGIASSLGIAFTQYPKHYMSQFHPDFNADNLDALVAEARAGNWVDLFEIRGDTWRNPDKPTLNAWRVIEGFGDGTRVLAERNPYYFKVDTEGNQLPYIDRVVLDVFSDTEVLLLRTLAGEIDMIARHINELANLPILADAGQREGFRIFPMTSSNSNRLALTLNLTHFDPDRRALFNTRDFRAGLSHAINRQEINDLVFAGQLEIQQPSVFPEFPLLYNERLAKQHTEYDVDLANRYLDAAGVAGRDASGMRLDANGNRVTFTIFGRADQDFTVDALPIIAEYWKAVGIDAQVRIVERTLFREIRLTNDFDAMVDSGGAASLQDVFQDVGARYWLPVNNGSTYAILWHHWYIDREPQEEPPADVLLQLETWAQIKGSPDPEFRFEKMREIFEMAADQFFVIGVGGATFDYGVVKNDLANVPQTVLSNSFMYAQPGPTMPSTYFFDR